MLILIITTIGCNSNSNDSKVDTVNEEPFVEETVVEENDDYEIPKQEVVYCNNEYCGSAIDGSPYEAFGSVYCDLKCYADNPQ